MFPAPKCEISTISNSQMYRSACRSARTKLSWRIERLVKRNKGAHSTTPLLYYRQAFRLDSFVDKAHFREEQRLAQQIAAIIGKDRGTTLRQLNIPDDGSGASESSVSLLERGIQTLSLHTSNTTVTATGTLASVISAFPEHLSFDPEDETRNCFVSLLSDELVILILRYLDTTSIECFALVDRKARVFTLDREIWRYGIDCVLPC